MKSFERYGNPHKLVEFRMMILNHCSMNCKGCFYKRIDNNFNDFYFSYNFAKDLIQNEYKLETCYLLPTDIFDNVKNYELFDDLNFVETMKLFSYVGIASTLENDFDDNFYNIIKSIKGDLKIELQINLLFNKLFDINYHLILKNQIKNIKEKYGENVVINLAINTGFKLSEKEKNKLKKMLDFLSDDEIIELNFTFLFNPEINKDKKRNMMIESIKTINEFGSYYEKNDNFTKKYNDRTFLRKPAFTFLGNPNRIYLNPIIPFDEYVFVENEKYLVKEASYDSFLDTYGQIDDINSVILNKCNDCKNLPYCLGKGYFAIAKNFNLECFLDIN